MNNSEKVIIESFASRGVDITTIQWSLIVSSFGIGGLLGAFLGGALLKRMGRRNILVLNNVFVLASSVLIAFAPSWWIMAIGRIFTGITAGFATLVVSLYFTEISPISIRGFVNTLHQLGITIGILVAQFLSTPSLNLLGSDKLWPWLFAVPVGCGLMQILILPWMPESPTYLYQEYGKEAAKKSLLRLLKDEAVAEQYLVNIEKASKKNSEPTDIELQYQSSTQDNQGSVAESKEFGLVDLFTSQALRKQLKVGLFIQLSMQLSGIDAVFYYSTSVFEYAGVSNPALATTCLGIINVFMTILAAKYMDGLGRRSLLLLSWVGMCASYLCLAGSFFIGAHMGAVVSMTGVIIFFAIGPGCIAWFLIAEIFPPHAINTANTLGIVLNWVANFTVAFMFPSIQALFGKFTFFLFATTTFCFGIFTYRYVPETANKNIMQVTQDFKNY